jgi:hypothetical protein
MNRVPPVVLALGLITACNDPKSDDDGVGDTSSETEASGDGDGDAGDGDGDSGDGDGDSGDGDGDMGDGDGDMGDGDGDPPDIPDGLFAAVPDIQFDKFGLAPDHLFVVASESSFDDPRLLKISKTDATIEVFYVNTGSTWNELIASDSWLYTASASPVSRSSFDSASWSQIANFGGVGGISQLLATEAHVFVRRLNQDNDTLHRIDPDGGNPTLLLTADINNVRTNGTDVYAFVDGNIVAIDTQSGTTMQVYEGTTSYHVGESALYFRIDASLHTAGLDGSGLVEFVPEADAGGFPQSYAEDGQHLYWATDNANGGNTLRRIPVGGGEVEVLFEFESTQDLHELRLDDTHVWWLVTGGDEVGIWRATK